MGGRAGQAELEAARAARGSQACLHSFVPFVFCVAHCLVYADDSLRTLLALVMERKLSCCVGRRQIHGPRLCAYTQQQHTHTHTHTASSLGRHLSRIATCAHHRERNKELVVGVAGLLQLLLQASLQLAFCHRKHTGKPLPFFSPPFPLPLEFPLSTLG